MTAVLWLHWNACRISSSKDSGTELRRLPFQKRPSAFVLFRRRFFTPFEHCCIPYHSLNNFINLFSINLPEPLLSFYIHIRDISTSGGRNLKNSQKIRALRRRLCKFLMRDDQSCGNGPCVRFITSRTAQSCRYGSFVFRHN